MPQELIERPVPLRTGIGAVADTASTKSADAQRFYDQGLSYLHAYVWIEAARSFRQALRHDAQLAMAHVGSSIALGELNQTAESRRALATALTLVSGASEHDRRHIELRTLQAAAEDAPGDASRLATYRTALAAATTALPADAELWLLRGMAESSDPFERGQGSTAASIPHYQRALDAVKDHPAAHHYLAHAYENTGRLKEAVVHGRAYAQLAPEIPHARHMYGHSLRRLGQIKEAVAEFEAADRLHRAYFKAEAVPTELDWHYHHNLDLLASSYRYLGQMKKAEAHYKTSFALPSNLVTQLFLKRAWPEYLRARGRAPEAFDAARILKGHPHPLVQATGYIEAGYAVLAAGRFADAAVESNAALKILRGRVEGGAMAANALLGLQGEIALKTAQREKGREMLTEVAARLQALPGPDNWVQALFMMESLARTARSVGDWELAGRLAAQMIAHDPAYAGGHYLAGLVAERAEDLTTARREFGLAQSAWAAADPDLPELQEIRKKLR